MSAGGGRPPGFVILCLGRTGSSHLVALLDSHPELRCYGEVLNMTHPAAAPEGWFGDAAHTDPVAHLRSLLADPGGRLAGFKLPLNSVRETPAAAAWLRADRAPAVVRLSRRNALALLLSRRLLRATLVSQSLYGDYGETTVRIEPRQCIRALETIEEEERELDELAEGHPVFRLSYEELAAGERLEELQRFLGVEPRPLSSDYERLRQRPFAETISNWEELRRALLETRFAGLVEE